MTVLNQPELWKAHLPVPENDTHKYDRGHGVVVGSSVMTGAGCLAAEAMMRMGGGLCTILSPPETASIYRSYAPYLLVEEMKEDDGIADHLSDERRNAILIGSGLADIDGEKLRKMVLDVLSLKRAIVIDASALTVFEGCPEILFEHLHDKVVLTPHMGEFDSLFPDIKGDPLTKAQEAVTRMKLKGVLVLKGAETIICTLTREPVVNQHASSYLASSGTGDVLAGMIGGLLAQGMPSFEAACAAVWVHGEAGLRIGAGLVASDISSKIPQIMKEFI